MHSPAGQNQQNAPDGFRFQETLRRSATSYRFHRKDYFQPKHLVMLLGILELGLSHVFIILPCLTSTELWIGFTILHLFAVFSLLYHFLSFRHINIMDDHASVALFLRKHGQEYKDDTLEFYCKVCVSPVDLGTRHCRTCNMCVKRFDHHSSWLNICVGSKNLREYDNIILVLIAYLGSNLVIHVTPLVFYWIPSKHRTDFASSPLAVLSDSGLFYAIFLIVQTTVLISTLVCVVRYYFFFDWLQATGVSTYEYETRIKKNRSFSQSFEGNRPVNWNKVAPFLENGCIVVNPQWETKRTGNSPGKWKILKQSELLRNSRGGPKKTFVATFLQERGVGSKEKPISSQIPQKRILKPDLPPKLPSGLQMLKDGSQDGGLGSERLPSSPRREHLLKQSSDLHQSKPKELDTLPPIQKSKFSKEIPLNKPQKNNFFKKMSDTEKEGSTSKFGRIEFANDQDSVVKLLRRDSDIVRRVQSGEHDLPATQPAKLKKPEEKKILRATPS